MKQFLHILLAMIFLLVGPLVQGQDKPATSSAETIEQYRVLIKETMEKNKLVGVGAALVFEDGRVWKEGFGYADKERKIPYTSQTTQPIGSITKPITALGIMQLQERGQLHIDRPLLDYLPQFSVKTRGEDLRRITLRSLIGHTSGLANDFFLNATLEGEKYTGIVDYLKDEVLAFPPGTIYHYSNVGYCLLGHAILAVSKQDYPVYMQKNVLQAAGMTHSGFLGYDPLQQLSVGYDGEGMPFQSKKIRTMPAGALYSNLDDMVSLARELIAIYHGKTGGFLSPKTVREIFSEQKGTARIMEIKTGLGWAMNKNDSGMVVLHFGSDNVSNAGLLIEPEKKMAAVMLINTAGGEVINDLLSEKFFASCGVSGQDQYIHHLDLPSRTDIVELTPEQLQKHAGTYPHTRTLIEVVLEDKELVLKSDFGNFRLRPVAPDEFIPCKVVSPEKCEMMTNRRFLFKDIKGYHVLFLEDAARSRKPLAYKLGPQVLNDAWKNRLGKYEIVGYRLGGKETFSRAEISLSDRQVLHLKIFYTSGEYVYYLRIENENDLVVCGFDDVTGGDTLQFSRDKGIERLRIYGLTMKKTD
jgi:CubicO group peptidase (beta-lactamase class C family)